MADEKKLVIALGTPDAAGGPPALVLGMTPAGFEHMRDGETHTMDLRKVGINLQVIVCRGETHAELVTMLGDVTSALNMPLHDQRGTDNLPDLGIDPPTEH